MALSENRESASWPFTGKSQNPFPCVLQQWERRSHAFRQIFNNGNSVNSHVLRTQSLEAEVSCYGHVSYALKNTLWNCITPGITCANELHAVSAVRTRMHNLIYLINGWNNFAVRHCCSLYTNILNIFYVLLCSIVLLPKGLFCLSFVAVRLRL